MTTGIKETVSEKRRGRPRAFGDDAPEILAAAASGILSDISSRRGRVDVYYRLIAISALRGRRGFRWYMNQNLINAGVKRGFRATVLTELGRFRDPRTIRDAARFILRSRYRGQVRTSRDAAGLARRMRLVMEQSA